MMTSSMRRESKAKANSYLHSIAIDWIILVAGLLVFLLFIIFTLSSQYNFVTEQERSQLATQVEIVQRSLSDKLLSVRNAHINIRSESLEGLIENESRSVYVRKRLRGFAQSISSVGVMLVLDKQGQVVESSDAGFLGQDLSERDYFKDAKRQTQINTLNIHQTFVEQAGTWTIAATMVLPDLNGHFNGLIVTVLEPDALLGLLRSVLYAADVRASFAHADGALFLLEPKHASDVVNMSATKNDFYSAHIESGKEFNLKIIKNGDELRMSAFRTMNMQSLQLDKALLFAVSRDLRAVYASWRSNAYVTAGLYAALVLSSVPGLYLLRRRRHLARTEALIAEQALREKNIELELLNEQLNAKSERLRAMAFVDGLTEVANRRRFDKVVNAVWSRYTRDALPLSLLMIDLDFFKEYNDHYGHQEGDRCLQAIAGCLSEVVVRPQDLVARYGGEEFACLLPNTDLQGAQCVAQKLIEAVAQLCIPHAKSSIASTVTISVGIATMTPTFNGDVKQLLLSADKALYAAKQSGRNKFCYF